MKEPFPDPEAACEEDVWLPPPPLLPLPPPLVFSTAKFSCSLASVF